MTTFGKKLKVWRESRSLSQQQLAVLLSVTDGAISAWELGRSRPRLAHVRKFVALDKEYFTTDVILN